MTKMDGKTPDIAEENIAKLKQLFPEVCCEDKVDFDKLKQILGDYVDDDAERYNFTWNGKGRALKLSQTPSTGTLRPCKEESKNWDDTENLYIEGDNLEVLKLLQKSYYGKVKMIYIDPPYNTGNDFVYKDDFKDGIKNYKKITGQINSEGNKISTNSETSGRYHTDWLNMMYPRLRLARNLLTDDGFLFASIDDNEVNNLRELCNVVFGEDSFVGLYIKQSKVGGGSDSKFIVKEHEYCLVYSKSIVDAQEMYVAHDDQYLLRYKEEDDKGKFFWDTFARPGLKNPIHYEIEAPDGTKMDYGWIHSKERFEQELKNGEVRIEPKKDGSWSVQFKQYLNLKGKKPRSMTMDFGGSIEGKMDLKKLFFEDNKVFGYPKSAKYIKTLISTIDDKEGMVLDFFSGSASTADAVMQLNAEDSGNRKFIMVQLPEETDGSSEAYKAGYKNICEIGKERIRRAGKKIKVEIEEENKQVKMGEEPKKVPDIGFKVLKLDSSNIKKWQPDDEKVEDTLLSSINNFMPDRTESDVVYEIMLKLGLNLTYPIEVKEAAGKKIYSIGMGSLMICLDDDITIEVAEIMIKLHNELHPEIWKVVFKDNGFKNDSAKINIFEIFKSAGLDEDAFTTI